MALEAEFGVPYGRKELVQGGFGVDVDSVSPSVFVWGRFKTKGGGRNDREVSPLIAWGKSYSKGGDQSGSGEDWKRLEARRHWYGVVVGKTRKSGV